MRVEPCSLASKLDWLATFNVPNHPLARTPRLQTKSDVRCSYSQFRALRKQAIFGMPSFLSSKSPKRGYFRGFLAQNRQNIGVS